MAYYPMNFKWQEVGEQHIWEDVYLNNMHTHKVFSDKMEAISHTFMQEPVFRNLGKVAKYAALSEHDKHAYKASFKAYRDSKKIRIIGRWSPKDNSVKILSSFRFWQKEIKAVQGDKALMDKLVAHFQRYGHINTGILNKK